MDQGLPIAFENNAATWQNMPGMAAFYTGRQNQIAEDNIGMLQKAFEAEQAFKAQQRPIELQNLVKSGVLTEAQARHQDALTRASGLTSDKAEAIMPGEIASTNAKNAMESAQAEQAQSAAKAIHMASWLQGPGKYAPPFMQAQKFMEMYGIQDTPDGSKGRQIIADMPKLIPLLEMEAKKAFTLSPKGQETSMKEEGDDHRNAATNATTRYVADTAAGSREAVAAMKNSTSANDILVAVQAGKLSYEKAAASFYTLSQMEQDVTKKQVYKELADKFEQANLAQKAAGVTGKVDPGALGLPTQQPNRVLGGNGGLAPGTQLYFDAQGNLVQGKQ